MSKLEIRFNTEAIEVRKTDNGMVAVGYAIRYNKLSQNLGGFVERFAPGSAEKTVKEQDIRALFNHESGALLGRRGANTLRISSDAEGVPYEIDLPDTTIGRDVAVLLERGDIVGASPGFRAMPGGQEWGQTDNGFALRTLNEIMLAEISLVPNPAYLDSSAALRSLAEATGKELEEVRALADGNDLLSLITDRDENEEDESRAKPTQVFHRSHLI